MATLFVNSNAVGANNGTSWADAYTSIVSTVGAATAAGDVVKVEYRHVQRAAGVALSLDWYNGTRANPVKLFSVDKDNGDALRSGAIVGTDGSNFWELAVRGCIFGHGLVWEAGYRIYLANLIVEFQRYENCTFKTGTYANGGELALGSAAAYQAVHIELIDCTYHPVTFAAISITADKKIKISRLTLAGGTPGSTPLLGLGGHADYASLTGVTIEDSDLSAVTNLAAVNAVGLFEIEFKRCKLHASAVAAFGTMSSRFLSVYLENCDDGTITLPPLGLTSKDTYFGKVSSTLTCYRTGGADDGLQANPHSWEMTTNANALEIYSPLESIFRYRFVDPDASIAGATAKGIFTSTRCSPLTAPAALTTDGSSVWNGSGVGTKQKISLVLTNGKTLTVYVASGVTLENDEFWIEVSEPDQVGGLVEVKFFLAKPSTMVYVDPKLEVL